MNKIQLQTSLDKNVVILNFAITVLLSMIYSCTFINGKEAFQGKWYVTNIFNAETNERLPPSSYACSYIELLNNDSCVFYNSIKRFDGTWVIEDNKLILTFEKESLIFKIEKNNSKTKIIEINNFIHYLSEESEEQCNDI
jgi:hypothetical protein